MRFYAGGFGGAAGFLIAVVFATSAVDATVPRTVPLPAPVAPTLTSVAGGSLPAHSDYVVITYVANRGETQASPETVNSVGPNTVTLVHSPAPIEGAIGYNVYAAYGRGQWWSK